ncbi:MAG: hypothetical protein U0840_10260 [Gemmataceae bacterium]
MREKHQTPGAKREALLLIGLAAMAAGILLLAQGAATETVRWEGLLVEGFGVLLVVGWTRHGRPLHDDDSLPLPHWTPEQREEVARDKRLVKRVVFFLGAMTAGIGGLQMLSGWVYAQEVYRLIPDRARASSLGGCLIGLGVAVLFGSLATWTPARDTPLHGPVSGPREETQEW